MYAKFTCQSAGTVEISIGEDHKCLDEMYTLTVTNDAPCATVDDACICFQWDLSCLDPALVTEAPKAIADEDTSDFDVEIFVNQYFNENACNCISRLILFTTIFSTFVV